MFANYLFSCFYRKRPNPEKKEMMRNDGIENMNVRVTEKNTDSLCSDISVERESTRSYRYNPN